MVFDDVLMLLPCHVRDEITEYIRKACIPLKSINEIRLRSHGLCSLVVAGRNVSLRSGVTKEGMKEVLYDRLPVSGMSGTLKNRLKNSVAYGNIHAKTGTVKAVCTLAGYATAANGHVYAFVLLNTGMQSSRAARLWQDKVCELLCR